eukprot:842498-Pyramimonas_sp.AAC.1
MNRACRVDLPPMFPFAQNGVIFWMGMAGAPHSQPFAIEAGFSSQCDHDIALLLLLLSRQGGAPWPPPCS